jgi:hypothetical protein
MMMVIVGPGQKVRGRNAMASDWVDGGQQWFGCKTFTAWEGQ